MKITRSDDDGDRKVLQIEATWSEIEADHRNLVHRYANIRVPGFRPGKTPRSVIEQRFKKDIVEDLKALITQRLSREALAEAGAEALGPMEAPEIECEPGKPFRAKIRYLPMPQFSLPDLAHLKADDDGTDARDRISRRLLELVPFALPDELVRQELERDSLAESPPESEAWTAASDRIRLMIILKKIAEQEGIGVDETDVDKRIAEKAQEFGTTKEALRKDLAEGGGTVRLKDMLLCESALEYLLGGGSGSKTQQQGG